MQRFKKTLAWVAMLAVMALPFLAPMLFSGCGRAGAPPKTVELTLAQATAIGAEALATVGEAYNIAVQEGIADAADRDKAFRELRPILIDAQAVTALLDDATSLSKGDLDRLLAFVDRTGNVFARLANLQKLTPQTREKIGKASLWLTRVMSATRIALAAIPPTQRNVAIAPNAARLATIKIVVQTSDLPLLSVGKPRTVDGAIDRLTNLGTNLVVRAFEIGRMDVVRAKEARELAFKALEFKLQAVGL